MVWKDWESNLLLTKRFISEDFPTPPSPSNTTFKSFDFPDISLGADLGRNDMTILITSAFFVCGWGAPKTKQNRGANEKVLAFNQLAFDGDISVSFSNGLYVNPVLFLWKQG